MITRKEIEAEYDVRDGSIQSPGKFEGDPVYAPYFWDIFLCGEGGVEELDGSITFEVIAADVEMFPELSVGETVRLWESDSGFVYAGVIPAVTKGDH